MKCYQTVLSIAGSDCSGGAGIQADLKTFSALGCYGMSIITALTAQNTLGVQNVLPISAEFVISQCQSIFTDIKVNAIKIGMLHDEEIIKALAHFFKDQSLNIVLDPVMFSKNNNPLLQLSAINALKENLFPLATIITPNIPEAEHLLNMKISNKNDMEFAAKKLSEYGMKSVLIKGGHLENSDASDCLYLCHEEKMAWFTHTKIVTNNNHGTGCTLSSAIAAYLAQGNDLISAVTKAKEYLTLALAHGKDYKLGNGIGPVQHFFEWW